MKLDPNTQRADPIFFFDSATKPGGWVEFQDWDPFLYSEDGTTKGTGIEKYYTVIRAAFQKVGRVFGPGPKLEEWMREAGFVDVHVEKFKLPMGAWPKDKHFVRFAFFFSLLSSDVKFTSNLTLADRKPLVSGT